MNNVPSTSCYPVRTRLQQAPCARWQEKCGICCQDLLASDAQNRPQEVQYKFDMYIVDGASNVQSAGDAVAAYFPCVTTVHGSEHGIHLVFADIAKSPAIKVSSSCSLFRHIPLHR